MPEETESRDLTSEVPNDAQHPIMYERAIYILGVLSAMCIIGGAVLFGRGQDGASLLTVAASAIGIIGMIFQRGKTA